MPQGHQRLKVYIWPCDRTAQILFSLNTEGINTLCAPGHKVSPHSVSRKMMKCYLSGVGDRKVCVDIRLEVVFFIVSLESAENQTSQSYTQFVTVTPGNVNLIDIAEPCL